jgi:hypothetical protein
MNDFRPEPIPHRSVFFSSLTLAATCPGELPNRQETDMLKFIGGTIGAIFLIGLIVVVLLFKLIF